MHSRSNDDGRHVHQARERAASSSNTYSKGPGKAPAAVKTGAFTCVLVLGTVLLGPTSSFSQVACKPLLSVKPASEARTPSPSGLSWTWKATIAADAGYCATRSGTFEIDFIRSKENAPDLQFTQRFPWGPNQFDVSMELSQDEAIHEFRIGFIAPCPCRELSQLSSEARAAEPTANRRSALSAWLAGDLTRTSYGRRQWSASPNRAAGVPAPE